MEESPTRIREPLVGLGEVEVLGADDESSGPLAVHIRTGVRPVCGAAGASHHLMGRPPSPPSLPLR